MNLLNNIEEKVKLFLERQEDILAVYLLGSALTGTLKYESDIDLGIMMEPGKKLSVLKRIELAGILSYELKRNVDMGEISSRNLIYAREALLKGIPVFQRDSEKVNLYRSNLLGLYIQFNFDRQEVLNAYRSG